MGTTKLNHIGFIVDGNRRWARERNLPTLEGHRRGFDIVEDIAIEVINRGISYASFYLFSTENWDRSEEEVSYLMDLVRKNITRLVKKLQKENIRCVIMGRPEPVEPSLWQKLLQAEKDTENNTRGTVCICFNYGGKWEIADAMSQIISERIEDLPENADSEAIKEVTKVTPEDIEAHLYHPEVPPCDLVVRTSGEERISGFHLWRSAYSEFLFLKKYFPEMSIDDLDGIIENFENRQRRFGK